MKKIEEPKREFQNRDRVIAGYQKMEMIVLDAELTLKGWRYQLAHTKKDGTIDKRKIYRFFYADNLALDATQSTHT